MEPDRVWKREGMVRSHQEILISFSNRKCEAKICQKSGCASAPYPVPFEITVIKYHDGDLFTTVKPPYLVIVHFLNVSEPATSEIILYKFEKSYLLCKECIFVFLGFTGEIEALVIRYFIIIFPVLVKSGELPPVDVPLFVSFAVEHVGINVADGKTAVINPASSVFQEPARSTGVILRPQCIPRDIEYTILVAEFRSRCGFESGGFQCF